MSLVKSSSRGWVIAKWCLAHLAAVRAPDMAAALAFRTLFGLIPVLFVATLVTRSLMGEEFPRFVRSMGELAGLDAIHGPSTVDSPLQTAPALSAWIEGLVAYTGTLNFSALGFVGIAVVIASALWLIVAIEESFNIVCRVPNSRGWGRRILVYWSVLTLGPVILAALPFVTTELRNMLFSVESARHAFRFLEPILGFLLLWGLLIFSYGVIPAQRMHWSPTLLGALVGALGLEVGRSGLGFYIERAFAVNRLYGSLGFVPLFMFWVYAMWLIVLFGLQVSSLLNILMNRESRRTALDPPTPPFDPSIAVAAMEWLARRFGAGQPCHVAGLADALALDIGVTNRLVDRLVESQFIVVARDEGLLSPARPLDSIPVEAVLRVGFEMASERRTDGPGGIVERLRNAQVACVAGLTLASKSQPAAPPVETAH